MATWRSSPWSSSPAAWLGGTLDGRDGETAELRYFGLEERPKLFTEFPLEELLRAGRAEAYFEPPPPENPG